MGQCAGTKSNKIKPDTNSQALDQKLETIRATLLTSIHSLHIICLECTEGIEKCLIENDRSLAITLRLKYIFLKNKSAALQDSIKKIDEIEPTEKSSKKKDAIHEAETVIDSLNLALAQKDVEKILRKEKDYNEEILKQIKLFQINESDAEKFVDNEIQERNSSPSRRNRRRYSRRLTSL